MSNFFPFIHKIKEKTDDDLQPLYQELYIPLIERDKEEEKETNIIIIELY